MTVFRRIAFVVAGVAGLGLVAARPGASAEEREVARIRSHFDSVLVELEGRDVSRLAPSALEHRTALVTELRRYRDAGAFPHNYDFPGEDIPYFVDRKTGAICAVGNLLAKSGRGDIVERVRASNNNVWVAGLRSDTAFRGWLDANGLTLAEAARIQMPYREAQSSTQQAKNVAFGVATLGALAGSTVTGLWNLAGNSSGQHSKLAKTGIVLGVMSGVLGARLLTNNDFPPTAGQTALGVGVASAAIGMHSLYQRKLYTAQQDSSRARAVAAAHVEPTIDARGAAGARVGMSIGF